MGIEVIGFGGGCHWCTEAVFQSLRGVKFVRQGFIKSRAPADTWSEAVIVTFGPDLIDLATLINVHVCTHASTCAHSMRRKYRSAIYVFSDGQGRAAAGTLDRLQCEFENKLIAQCLTFIAFKPSGERFLDYYKSNPDKPFCRRYIDPKLDLIRREFGAHASPLARRPDK